MTPSTSPGGLAVFALLVSLGTYRLTVLALRDTITAPIRGFVTDRWGGMLVNTFTKCPWCISVWLAAGLTTAGYFWWDWFRWVLIGLTAAAVTGILAEKT